ncbi:NAD(P)/FAD-dependent oxidoreductase [Ascidiimonas sp. W6]|uniref:NAD(P)/FAD-dependent oxidoreductase n=1 Tax=Ascidiimonas meishanensis TaxID=3128903 RepID=UPI0030ED976B
MPAPHYHTIIAGAGPGGCAAAIRLRQQRLRVAIIDDVNDEQLKVGESLPGASLRLLGGLGINGLPELLPNTAFEACVANKSAWGSDHWTYTDALRNPEGGGWHVMRNEFDAALRKKAQEVGVDFYSGKVGAIAKEDEYTIRFKTQKLQLPEALTANWLIDATGRAAALLRQLGVSREKFEPQMAAICWLHPNANDKDRTTTIKSVAKGWWYTSRLPDGSRVLSFHGLPETVAKMVKDPQYYLKEANTAQIINYNLHLNSILQGITARDAGVSKATEVIGKNWFALGDAALSFDPLSSQGIFFALYSGLQAANALLKTQAGNLQAQETYQQQVNKVFQANQRSRQYFYTAERRFLEEGYWQRQLPRDKILKKEY